MSTENQPTQPHTDSAAAAAVLELLTKPMRACEWFAAAKVRGISARTFYRHLRQLEEAGEIRLEEDGQRSRIVKMNKTNTAPKAAAPAEDRAKIRFDWETLDFKPDGRGWRAIYVYDDRVITVDVVGWLIQREAAYATGTCEPVATGEGFATRVIAGVFDCGSAEIVPAVDEDHGDYFWRLRGPDEDKPISKEETAEARKELKRRRKWLKAQ